MLDLCPFGDKIHKSLRLNGSVGDISDAVGRISKWALELMGHDIRYIPRTTIKSQALVDFVAEWMEVQLPTLDVPRVLDDVL